MKLRLIPRDSTACRAVDVHNLTKGAVVRKSIGRNLIAPSSSHANQVEYIHLVVRVDVNGECIATCYSRDHRSSLNGQEMIHEQEYPLRDGDVIGLLHSVQAYLYDCQIVKETPPTILGKRKVVHQQLLTCAVCFDSRRHSSSPAVCSTCASVVTSNYCVTSLS